MNLSKILLKIFGIIVFYCNTSFAQVNTEEMRKLELKTGLTVTGVLNLQIAKGNSEFFNYNSQLRFDYRKNKWYTFLISDFKKGKLDDNKFINKGFTHYRNVFSFDKTITSEIFLQIEYDEFIKLKQRELVGAGLRIKPIEK